MKSHPSSQSPASVSRKLLPLLTTVLALLPLARAAADKTTKLPLSIYCFEYAGDIKSADVRSGKSAFSPVALSTANVIDAGEVLAANGTITLHGPAAGEVEHPVVATLQVGDIRKPLAVLAPAAEGEETTYRSHVIDADEKSFPMGSYRFVNLSPFLVRINFGDHSMEFESNSDKLFNPKVAAGELLAVTIEYKSGENWLNVSSSRWAYRKDRRTLVCIEQNAQTKRMLLKSIPLR